MTIDRREKYEHVNWYMCAEYIGPFLLNDVVQTNERSIKQYSDKRPVKWC